MPTMELLCCGAAGTAVRGPASNLYMADDQFTGVALSAEPVCGDLRQALRLPKWCDAPPEALDPDMMCSPSPEALDPDMMCSPP